MNVLAASTPRSIIDRWHQNNWPPEHMRQVLTLPIYLGSHAAVTAFGQTLADTMALLSSHIEDECRGVAPRWMKLPKLVFGAERVNIVDAPAKASKRLVDLDELVARCGMFHKADMLLLHRWFLEHPGESVVAHKEFKDLRAYVFGVGQAAPQRHRFHQSGLVIAVPEGVPASNFAVQDHRGVVRQKRCDSYSMPLAKNANGWSVFAQA